MSLLKWKEMARSKSALGKKINFVHNAITQKKLGDETSQIGFEKMFRPITTKLDDVVASNVEFPPMALPASQKKKKSNLKEIDYFPEVNPFEDMDVEGLFDEAVPPQPEKQIPATPPTYEEIMQEVGDDPPEYEDETPDYNLEPEDEEEDEDDNDRILDGLNIINYKNADIRLRKDILISNQIKYAKELVDTATFRRNQLKGYKSAITKKFKKGEITEEMKNLQHQRINKSFKVLNEYIWYYRLKVKEKQKQKKGSGIRRKKGGAISFFSNPKDLLQKLEVIIGSILAGNTNLGIRNTGVGILDLLLKEGAINKSQHEKIFRKYFKP